LSTSCHPDASSSAPQGCQAPLSSPAVAGGNVTWSLRRCRRTHPPGFNSINQYGQNLRKMLAKFNVPGTDVMIF
jgi:hypothetical protein